MKKSFLLCLLSFYTLFGEICAQESKDTFVYQVGEYEVVLLSEGQQEGKIGILIDATPEILEKYAPDGTFPNATNAFLIKTPDKNILVDTGHGRKLFDNLNSTGVSAGDIDIILITHMHGDHIGGLLKGGAITFPNATIYLPQPEYDYWMNDEAMNNANNQNGFKMAREVVAAYGRDRIELFQPNELNESSSSSLIKGVTAYGAYGHTPGHTMYLLESGSNKLLIWGDLTHAMAVQMPHPEIAVTYDVNPEDAINARKATLEYVTRHNIPIAGMHIAWPALGNITNNPKGGYFFNVK